MSEFRNNIRSIAIIEPILKFSGMNKETYISLSMIYSGALFLPQIRPETDVIRIEI